MGEIKYEDSTKGVWSRNADGTYHLEVEGEDVYDCYLDWELDAVERVWGPLKVLKSE